MERDWGCISPKFLTIFCVSMSPHHHNLTQPIDGFAQSYAQPNPQMDLLKVMPNLAHQVTPNRPIILLSIQPIIF